MMKKRKIGLVLGGGAALGYAHIGALEILEEYFDIAYIIGCSMGAIVGGLYASGHSPAQILAIAETIPAYEYLSYLKLNIKAGGFINSVKLEEFLAKQCNNQLIEECKIPFAAIGMNMHQAQGQAITSGKLATAMMASASLPFVFPAYRYNKENFYDGGIEYPLPLEFCELLHNENIPVCAVNVLQGINDAPAIYTPTNNASEEVFFLKSALKSMLLNQSFLSLRALKSFKPAVYIHAHDPRLMPWEFNKAKQFYQVGKLACIKALDNDTRLQMDKLWEKVVARSGNMLDELLAKIK